MTKITAKILLIGLIGLTVTTFQFHTALTAENSSQSLCIDTWNKVKPYKKEIGLSIAGASLVGMCVYVNNNNAIKNALFERLVPYSCATLCTGIGAIFLPGTVHSADIQNTENQKTNSNDSSNNTTINFNFTSKPLLITESTTPPSNQNMDSSDTFQINIPTWKYLLYRPTYALLASILLCGEMFTSKPNPSLFTLGMFSAAASFDKSYFIHRKKNIAEKKAFQKEFGELQEPKTSGMGLIGLGLAGLALSLQRNIYTR